SKKSSSPKKHATGENDENRNPRQAAEPSSPVKSATTNSHPPATAKRETPRKTPRPASPASPATRDQPPSGKPRSSRSFGRQATDPSSLRRKKHDPDTHPLNLHPDEYKRLSALSAMSDRSSFDKMDVDREPSAAPPSSPPAQQQSQAQFTVPISSPTNGNKSPTNGDGEGPVPPPHRSHPSSPVPCAADEAEAYKAAGNKFFTEKDYKNAILQYSKALEVIPDSSTYLSNRAAAYMSGSQYEAALEDCSRAVDLDPSNSKFLLRLARIYTSLGRPDEALTTFGRIQPPPSAKDMAVAKEMQLHVKAASDALNSGTSGSMALHALDQAEKLLGFGASKPRKWQLMRGSAYLKMGGINSLGEAQNVAMAILRNNSQDPEALVLRGRALYAQGDNDKAIQHFRKALSCDPDFRDAVKWLRIVQKLDRMKAEGNTDYKASRWQAAFDKYTQALEVDPANRGINSKILQNRALCRLKLKQYDDAIADCERATSLDPQYMKARKTKANALGQADRWEDAVRELKSIQEIDPEDRSIAKEIRKAELELKKSQRKDYYKILNVAKDADDSTIKKAYRKLAIVHHPDKNPGDDAAAERFKDIGEAYETLSDSQKRARYDSGEDLVDPSEMFSGGGMGGGMGGIDPEILFQMMNGGAQFGGGGGEGFGGARFSTGG
ncbi:tetratricopeptide, partial [Xylariales sp. AK1849]